MKRKPAGPRRSRISWSAKAMTASVREGKSPSIWRVNDGKTGDPMDVSKAEKARLGAFLIGTCAIIAVVLFIMVGKNLLAKKVGYFTRLSETVSGLELGTPVKQNGVQVGNI